MTYIPDPANYTPKGNPFPKNAGINRPEAQTPIASHELEKLEGMSRDELLALVRRFTCQCGYAATMTDEETAQAMMDTLAETALKPVVHGTSMKADIAARLTAVEKWLDRKKGKPIGSSPMVQIGASGGVNVMIRLVDSAGNIELIEGN